MVVWKSDQRARYGYFCDRCGWYIDAGEFYKRRVISLRGGGLTVFREHYDCPREEEPAYEPPLQFALVGEIKLVLKTRVDGSPELVEQTVWRNKLVGGEDDDSYSSGGGGEVGPLDPDEDIPF